MDSKLKSASQVLMLVGTHCQHCAPVLRNLSELVKEGAIDTLEVINVERRPDAAIELGVQSVPWLRIGWFVLEGVRTKGELQQWIDKIGSEEGVTDYYSEILSHGRVKECLGFIRKRPETMSSVIRLIGNPEEKINVKLGVGVIMEEVAASEAFEAFIPALAEMCLHEDSRIRLDVCHYLSLTQKPEVIKYIEPLLKDMNEEVREEASDSIEALKENVKH